MRILYNSKDTNFKSPFGTLTEGQKCRISIHIPRSCKTKDVRLVFLYENNDEYASFSMKKTEDMGEYEIYSCNFSLAESALFFYYFRITTKNEEFSLYRQGYDMTNMEDGELWQLSCIPADFHIPEEYSGAVMYQIFPDRFNQSGECDTSGKLEPFWVHSDKNDVPHFLPNKEGEIENCDFYGGNLRGIADKLDYLSELGVTVIYLNPIFKAWSNHRYDTADYMKIDELLGTEADLSYLCDQAHKKGMKIILDGVFSHTGSNSRYFDKLDIFGGGAYHDPASPYRSWYDFKHYPDDYTSWWGIETLPCLNENDKSFRDFLINSEDSVLAHWIRAGADGFRLDVADELPDEFISDFRARLKGIDPDSLLIGEVWEDASNKISYGRRRHYFTGGELDSVMNYPFRTAIIDYVSGKDDGKAFSETVMTIAENYPAEVLHTLMNMLSTHDTPRILSVFSPEEAPKDKRARAGYLMSGQSRTIALARLRAATFLQFVLPGMPCIFYGDELGTEGFEDPFCRSYFRWDKVEDNAVREFFVRVSKFRRSNIALIKGNTVVNRCGKGNVVIERRYLNKLCRAYVNIGEPATIALTGKVVFCERASFDKENATLDNCGFLLEEIQ